MSTQQMFLSVSLLLIICLTCCDLFAIECPKCGYKNDDTLEYCVECGAELRSSQKRVKKKDRYSAGKSTFAAGWFSLVFPGGGHFYLEKTTRGLTFLGIESGIGLLALLIMGTIEDWAFGPISGSLFVTGAGVHIYNVIDAINCASQENTVKNLNFKYGYNQPQMILAYKF
ncbi:MAG: zinc-ribbon domain-containing protein [Elusimicrobiota bacterium]